MSKKIDWAKPVRMVDDHEPVKVIAVHGDQAFITWGREAVAYISNRQGKVDGAVWREIENVPEELYLRLYREDDGIWRLDGAGRGERWEGYDGEKALPRRMWDRYYGSNVEDKNNILVKVPG